MFDFLLTVLGIMLTYAASIGVLFLIGMVITFPFTLSKNRQVDWSKEHSDESSL